MKRYILRNSVTPFSYEYVDRENEKNRRIKSVTIQCRVFRDGSLNRGGIITDVAKLNEYVSSLKEGEKIEFIEAEHETHYEYVGDFR